MNIINRLVQNVISENMMGYSGYVIRHRSLPDLRDGLKPSHRRILDSMNDMNATKYEKSQNVEGQVMKKHPHGGTYSTIVGLVQTDNNLTPYIDGKGNFGQRTSSELQAAAARYTEVKLSELSQEILKETNEHVVNYIPNYDGTLKMPEVLAVKYPTILNMPQSGIAVGMSCNIPSFNLIELNNSIIKYLNEGEKTILIPDFPTGGKIIANEEMFKKINETGQGSIRLRGSAKIENNIIKIYEIPYTTTREKIIQKIVDLKKEKKLNEITSVKDLTGLQGMEIEIVVKRTADVNLVLEKIYQLTPLESGFGSNINVLHKDLPKQMGVWTVIEEWLKWRRECIKNKTKYEIFKLEKELHLLKGLEKVLINVDKAVEIIRFSPTEEQINESLMFEFKIDEQQADYIANMKLRKINQAYIQKQIKDIQELEDVVSNKYEILNSDESINNIICNDLEKANQKYGQPRRTEIVTMSERARRIITKVKKEIPDYAVKIYVTEQGYVKKVKANSTGTLKLKTGDKIKYEFATSNKHKIIVFAETDAHIVKIDTINECKSNQLGDYLPTMLNINEIKAVSVQDDKHKFILSLFDDHRLVKINLESFKTTRKKLSNSIYNGGKLINMITLEKEKDMLFVLKNGKTKKFNTKDFSLKNSRDSQGSKIGKTIIDMKLE